MNDELIEKLNRTAESLREFGGEDLYDLADACEDAASKLSE